jgi:hypothetical protein
MNALVRYEYCEVGTSDSVICEGAIKVYASAMTVDESEVDEVDRATVNVNVNVVIEQTAPTPSKQFPAMFNPSDAPPFLPPAAPITSTIYTAPVVYNAPAPAPAPGGVNFCREVSSCFDCTTTYAQGCAWNDNIVPKACVPIAECDYYYEEVQDRMVSLMDLGPTRSACKATPSQCGVDAPNGAYLDANEERGGGCTTHEQCSYNQYCFSCAKCAKLGFMSCGGCAPGPSYMGGVAGGCGPLSSCQSDADSITGACPSLDGSYIADFGYTNDAPVVYNAPAPAPAPGGVNFCREVSSCYDCTTTYAEGCAWNDNIVPKACVPIAECDYYYEEAQDRMVSLTDLGPTRSACKATPSQCGVDAPNGAYLDANEERGGGCTTHEQCGYNQYCFSCAKCTQIYKGVGCESCAPGPSYMGGVAGQCGPLNICRRGGDSITGTCPSGDSSYIADFGYATDVYNENSGNSNPQYSYTNSPYVTAAGTCPLYQLFLHDGPYMPNARPFFSHDDAK